jgi:threonine synthase
MEAFIFMPTDTWPINIFEAQLAGANVFLVDGLINDCGRIVREGIDRMGWFDISTMREPYRIEGKKTMGLEIAEQFGWSLPDVVVFPTGGGTGIIGMWKAFLELVQLGLVNEDELPRMVAVQSDGCCPLVRAFDSGAESAEPFANATSIARGLRVPTSLGDSLALSALRQSDGTAIAVEEARIPEWMGTASRLEGICAGPESATCIGAVEHLREARWISRGDVVVIFNCSMAQKTPVDLKTEAPRLQKDAVDWALIEARPAPAR